MMGIVTHSVLKRGPNVLAFVSASLVALALSTMQKLGKMANLANYLRLSHVAVSV